MCTPFLHFSPLIYADADADAHSYYAKNSLPPPLWYKNLLFSLKELGVPVYTIVAMMGELMEEVFVY
jgi:hypothetical protein